MRSTSKFLMVLVLAFCYINLVHSTEQDNPETLNNYQVDQIVTTEEGVFLLVDNIWLGTEGVLAMPGSFLVLNNGQWVAIRDVMNCDSYTWRCRICGYVNPQGVTRCLNYKNHPK